MLKNAALTAFGPQPEARRHFQTIRGKRGVAAALTRADAHAVEVACSLGQFQTDADRLAEQFIKGDVGAAFGDGVDVEVKQRRNSLGAGKADQKQLVFAERGGNGHWPMSLRVWGHYRSPRKYRRGHFRKACNTCTAPTVGTQVGASM